jgi:hypothetical protein
MNSRSIRLILVLFARRTSILTGHPNVLYRSLSSDILGFPIVSVRYRYRFEVEKAHYYKENKRAREIEEGRGLRVRREEKYY